MKKALTSFVSLLLLASCATYTVQDGRDAIKIPEETNMAETRYNVIKEREEREEDAYIAKLRAEAAARSRELKEREEKERAEKEAEEERLKALDINEYPDNLEALTFPHIYTPAKANELKNDDGIVTESLIFIPLGDYAIKDENIDSIIKSISGITPDFIALTGSIENQISFAEKYGSDAVTINGGTLIFRSCLEKATDDTVTLRITEKKSIELSVLNSLRSLPWTKDDVPSWIEEMKGNEESDLKEALDAISEMTGNRRLIFISSASPSTEDWSTITDYYYRNVSSFALSDAMNEMRWQDVYRATHFNAEVDPGITRRSYEVFERLDFIYSYGLMPISSTTMALSGLTEETGNLALLAEIVIPD